MTVTDQLSELQGHHSPHVPVSGVPTKIWAADITAVNPDGTVDCRPIWSRAGKARVPVPDSYSPVVGDRVLVCNLGGDHQLPVVVTPLTHVAVPPAASGTVGGDLSGTLPNPTIGSGKVSSAKMSADAAAGNMRGLTAVAGTYPFIGTAGLAAEQLSLNGGAAQITVAANTNFTIAHGLGRAPASFVGMVNAGPGFITGSGADTTNMTFQCSAALAANYVNWLALG